MEKHGEYIESLNGLRDFIDNSPSCYHVIDNVKKMLDANDFTQCYEHESWNLKPGKNYYVVRSDSSIIAFKIPTGDIKNYQIIASHSDSPCFKIKEKSSLTKDDKYVCLNVEKYGGMILSAWFDRPLSIAGRVVIDRDNVISTKLVDIDRDLVMIPNLAIHMDRNVNDGHKYQVQKEIAPIWSGNPNGDGLEDVVAKAINVEKEAIIGKDLFLYNRNATSVWGANNEYISGRKLDDLMCAYASVKAIVDSANANSVSICAIFDNEEVGSGSRQGADSDFLSMCIDRIASANGLTSEQKYVALAASFMVSADNAHAAHPNYLEKSDPKNKVYMNEGVVIKHSANQKYTTDSVSAALFRKICSLAGVPTQEYVNNSDVVGGSTLGNIASTHVSINTVDVGLAQLAMHSPYETAGVKDAEYMIKAFKKYYSTLIAKNSQNEYELR